MDECLSKMIKEAIVLENRLDTMTEKTSENYGIVLREHQDLMKTIKEEQERINSTLKMEQESERLEIERYKIEVEGERQRLNADIEEEKLRQQRSYWIKDIGKEIVKGIIVILGNGLLAYGMIRFNNSGETLTGFENKIINPLRFK